MAVDLGLHVATLHHCVAIVVLNCENWNWHGVIGVVSPSHTPDCHSNIQINGKLWKLSNGKDLNVECGEIYRPPPS